MPDIFEQLQSAPRTGDIFDQVQTNFNESFLKSSLRTLYQVPSGIAQAYTYPADVLSLLGSGEALDPEFIDHLRAISAREGVPFDEEKWKEGVQQALSYFPTQSNIERAVEEKTGAPLTPRTQLQKAVKLASTAGTLKTPGSSPTLEQRATAAVTAPAVSETAQHLGVPEPLAELAGLGASGIAGSKVPKVDLKAKKPSGLITRQYEKLEKPKEVSAAKVKHISEKVENEVRDIARNIVKESPIEETYSALKNDASFKQEAANAFRDVESIAEKIPGKFSTDIVKKELSDKVLQKKGAGFTASEFDKSHRKFVAEFLKETPKQDISAKDLVIQYRKNNKALSEVYEPGQSFAYNRAKREALLDYNKAIASTIEKQFPESEFVNLFKSTNEQWAKIMDVEAIDKFLNNLFDGKIRFEKGRQFFDKEGMTVPFKRALGEIGFKDFQQLMKDLMSTEQAHKMMKIATSKGYKDLADTAMHYVLHPQIGYAKAGYKLAKNTYKKLFEMLLDKPQIALTWDRGVQAFKKGDFKSAENEFNKIKAAEYDFAKRESQRNEALKKYKEHQKNIRKEIQGS